MALYIDDKPMTKKAALEFLKISPTFIPTTRRKIIQCNTKQVDRDKIRPYKSYGGKPAYLVFVPHLEREVSIRFATSQRKDKEDNFVYPFPKTLRLHPAEDGTMLIPDELEFLFWFLRPACEQSPFRDKNQQSYYSFKDDHSKAATEMEREEKYMEAVSILVGPTAWSDTQLKHLAKGMNIMGVDDMTPMVVKNELKKLAFKNPAEFTQKANSREIVFSGKIQEAIDHGILTLKNLNGMQRWYLKNEEILPITYGQNPLNELKGFMADKWYLFADKINEFLDGVDVASKLNNPINDEAFAGNKTTPPPATKSALTEQQIALLSKYKKEDWFEGKMQKIDGYDLENPELMHPQQRKSYEDNKELYEAWKAEKLAQETQS